MSLATLDNTPNQLSAGVLALLVHAILFGLLTYGMHWTSSPPEVLSVDLWRNLPNEEPIPAVEPPHEALTSPVVNQGKVAALMPADIQLRAPLTSQPNTAESAKRIAKEIKEREQAEELRLLEEYAKRKQAIQESVRAEVSAATAAEVGRFQDMIRSKIRRNIVGVPADLPDSAKAEFKVTLLPDGSVLDAKLVASSGNAAYDDAAERAIYKAQPLPLPKDANLQQMFRVLRLSIKPRE
ncbi:MAG: cell envelope integrity protein TolA [Sideroxydans sp.]|nr:cell envelope integrity protein TolA [Sideroxydans sp.]